MHCTRKITNDLYYVGGSDRRLEKFENLFPIERGVSYNSYLFLDEKTCKITVRDVGFGDFFMATDFQAEKIIHLGGNDGKFNSLS